jgi:hypothetical protein
MNNSMTDFIDFTLLKMPVPEQIKMYSIEKQKEIYEYLQNMDENDKKAYLIAMNHLGSSFNIYRSNGFKEWKQNKKNL